MLLCCQIHYSPWFSRDPLPKRAKDVGAVVCDERLNTKVEESTRLAHTGLLGELEHLKIKTRLIDEKFASVMGKARAD